MASGRGFEKVIEKPARRSSSGQASARCPTFSNQIPSSGSLNPLRSFKIKLDTGELGRTCFGALKTCLLKLLVNTCTNTSNRIRVTYRAAEGVGSIGARLLVRAGEITRLISPAWVISRAGAHLQRSALAFCRDICCFPLPL